MKALLISACSLLWAFGLSSPTWAQQNARCSASSGSCPGASTKLQQYGTAPTYQSNRGHGYPSTYSSPSDVQPHHTFLPSVACKDLSEAIRTASARGVGAAGQQDLRKEWQQRCLEEDSIARTRYNEKQRAEQRERTENRQTADLRSARDREGQQARLEQCAEMRRNLAKRRERTDLNAGEKDDLQRFEASYRDRCTGG